MLDLLIAVRAYRNARANMVRVLRDTFPSGAVVAVVIGDQVVFGQCVHVGDNPDELAIPLPEALWPTWGRYYSGKIERFHRVPGGLPSR